jgi:hypothetical protein
MNFFGGKILQFFKFVKNQKNLGFSAHKIPLCAKSKEKKMKKNTEQHNVQGAHHPPPPSTLPNIIVATS